MIPIYVAYNGDLYHFTVSNYMEVLSVEVSHELGLTPYQDIPWDDLPPKVVEEFISKIIQKGN